MVLVGVLLIGGKFMAKNTIKRTSNYMIFEWLVDTNITKKGDKSYLKKDDLGWHDSIRKAFVCVSCIRNENVCRIIDQWQTGICDILGIKG